MSSRSASDKLLGYFYQFDRSIFELLNLTNHSERVTLEGYEDIDTGGISGGENIQIKYLTSQNIFLKDGTLAENEHIEKPILLSFLTYCETGKPQKIIGYYNGTSSQIISIDREKLSDIIIRRSGLLNSEQNDILTGTADSIKDNFVRSFTIQVVDKTYEEQVNEVKDIIKMSFSLSTTSEVDMYYNYCLSKIIHLVSGQEVSQRTISKGDFIVQINQKDILFNQWFLEKQGLEKYLKLVKKQYFTYTTIPAYERIFILHISNGSSLEEIKNVILNIRNKFFKRRDNIPKPYFFLSGISDAMLIELKHLLWQEECISEDGYYYHSGAFYGDYLCRTIDSNQPPQIKILNNINDLISVIPLITKTLQIYEFYITTSLNIETTKEYHKISIRSLNDLTTLFN